MGASRHLLLAAEQSRLHGEGDSRLVDSLLLRKDTGKMAMSTCTPIANELGGLQLPLNAFKRENRPNRHRRPAVGRVNAHTI